MARPKRKHSLEYLRQQGEKMFLAGTTGYEIARKLDVTDQTVSNWKKRYNWAEKYQQIHDQHLQVKIQEVFARTDDKINDLESIQKAAITPIKDGRLTPQYFGEASKVYMDAAKLENDLRQASINTSFIRDIARIILEEVSDVDIINRIKVKIMALMQKDTQKVLAISGGQEVLEEDVAKELKK